MKPKNKTETKMSNKDKLEANLTSTLYLNFKEYNFRINSEPKQKFLEKIIFTINE